MGSFLINQKAYSINSETEVATILSNFSTDFIYGVIEDILAQRTKTFSNMERPNFVMSLENTFKEMIVKYPSNEVNIKQVRNTTYEEISNIIAKSFDLELQYDDATDMFTMAYYLFDFFIANYDRYVCLFFSRVITREKESLYNTLNLDESKKSKDISTIYNKKLYNDPKLALINANLGKVIGFLCTLDFPINNILETIYAGRLEVVSFLISHVRPQVDFFHSAYGALLDNPQIYPMALTFIKLEIQRQNVGSDAMASFQI